MSQRNDKYTYRVTWSAEDREYVGLCLEFPSLSWLGKSPEAALQGIRRTVASVVADMRAAAEVPPAPLSCRDFSGKFIVRLPPDVHRALAIEAAEQGISLNRLISSKLSRT
jgi:predicted HicB family RNase H-like nuclease